MPHCIIEYSQTLSNQIDASSLTDTVHQTVRASPLFDPKNVSTRIQGYDDFRGSEFVHVTIRLLQGRSDSEKSALTAHVGQAIEQLSLTGVKISCECVDIHSASFYY